MWSFLHHFDLLQHPEQKPQQHLVPFLTKSVLSPSHVTLRLLNILSLHKIINYKFQREEKCPGEIKKGQSKVVREAAEKKEEKFPFKNCTTQICTGISSLHKL